MDSIESQVADALDKMGVTYVWKKPVSGYESDMAVVVPRDDYENIKKRLSKLESRSGLLSPSLSRQLWAFFGRLVLLWIILGSVWLVLVLLAYAVSG